MMGDQEKVLWTEIAGQSVCRGEGSKFEEKTSIPSSLKLAPKSSGVTRRRIHPIIYRSDPPQSG
uniref:Uncharacterized protein n=1 Tax=Anguilla anguilla TaxID=7936 RepID=A0A0E9RIY0_ANGAN